MPISHEENDLITRVEGDAPLGQMLRQHYWMPAAPSDALEAGGKPFRLRMFGKDYVLFRNPQGEVGVLDEACPHRLASLALARNEPEGLQCIYHGWRFDTKGNVVDVPNADPRVREQFCKNVRFGKYKARELGGISWVWLGQGEIEPPMPALPFTELPKNQRFVTSVEVPTNWLQGVEATMDTSHLTFLHSSTIQIQGGTRKHVLGEGSAKLEFEDKPYGFRYAAIRSVKAAGQRYVRVNNFVMPWYSVICASDDMGPGTVFMSVPVDDVTHRAWFVHFNVHGPLGTTMHTLSPDLLSWPPLPPGGPKDNWGQDRGMMQRGHFSGFPQHLATEDFAMFMSQGRIANRAEEQLCDADGAIVRLRRVILERVQRYQQSEGKVGYSAVDYKAIKSVAKIIAESDDWRAVS
jgi:phthalate 4,5-dioxygenase oxygenase subunit